MSNFINRGGNFYPVAERALEVVPELPTGTYTLKHDIEQGFFFEPISSFDLPPKLYGDINRNTDRILETFQSRENSTGVLLSGEKGSGKTLLAKNLSNEAAKRYGIITVVIGSPFTGESFNTLIQNIRQPAVILFDEFEKTYSTDGPAGNLQESLLTLLDGVYPTKKLFILTTNDRYRIDSHMQNRPGRLFYSIEYNGIDGEFVREYCEDNLNNKAHINSVVNASALFYRFNFDMLKAIVEEMNRYNEDVKDAMRILNARPEGRGLRDYHVRLFVNEKEVKSEWLETPILHCSPLDLDEVEIGYYKRGPKTYHDAYEKWKKTNPHGGIFEEIDDYYGNPEFSSHDFVKVDGVTNSFTFKNEDGDILVLSRKYEMDFNYFAGI